MSSTSREVKEDTVMEVATESESSQREGRLHRKISRKRSSGKKSKRSESAISEDDNGVADVHRRDSEAEIGGDAGSKPADIDRGKKAPRKPIYQKSDTEDTEASIGSSIARTDVEKDKERKKPATSDSETSEMSVNKSRIVTEEKRRKEKVRISRDISETGDSEAVTSGTEESDISARLRGLNDKKRREQRSRVSSSDIEASGADSQSDKSVEHRRHKKETEEPMSVMSVTRSSEEEKKPRKWSRNDKRRQGRDKTGVKSDTDDSEQPVFVRSDNEDSETSVRSKNYEKAGQKRKSSRPRIYASDREGREPVKKHEQNKEPDDIKKTKRLIYATSDTETSETTTTDGAQEFREARGKSGISISDTEDSQPSMKPYRRAEDIGKERGRRPMPVSDDEDSEMGTRTRIPVEKDENSTNASTTGVFDIEDIEANE